MNNKLWIHDLKELFISSEIIPNKKHCIEKQLNSVTRMLFLIFIILIIFDIKISILFLFFSLLFIIIIYYIKRDNMQPEKYTDETGYINFGKPGRNKKTLKKDDKNIKYGKKPIKILKDNKKEFKCEGEFFNRITGKYKTVDITFEKLDDKKNIDTTPTSSSNSPSYGLLTVIRNKGQQLKEKIEDIQKNNDEFIYSINDLIIEMVSNPNDFENTCLTGIPMSQVNNSSNFMISKNLCKLLNQNKDIKQLIKDINQLNKQIDPNTIGTLQNIPTKKPQLYAGVNDGIERYSIKYSYNKRNEDYDYGNEKYNEKSAVLLKNTNNICPKLTDTVNKQQFTNYYKKPSLLKNMIGSGTLEKLGGNPRIKLAPNIAKPIVSNQWNPASVPSYINDSNTVSRNLQGFVTNEIDYNIKEKPMNRNIGTRSLDKFVADIQPGVTGNFEYDNQCSTLQGPRNKVILPLKEHFKYKKESYEEEQKSKDTYGYPYDESQIPTIKNPMLPDATNYNVYDPRSYGYGDENRGYIDKMTGQIKYFYDDVDAIRKPNYITRNNIDFMKNVGTTYGQVQDPKHTDPVHMRQQIHRNFLDNQLAFRNELQVRLLKKGNNIAAQRKSFPIRFS